MINTIGQLFGTALLCRVLAQGQAAVHLCAGEHPRPDCGPQDVDGAAGR